MAATTSRGEYLAAKATRSRLDTPIMGTFKAVAIAMAAATPTRNPV